MGWSDAYLEMAGMMGKIAAQLFRVQKASGRAKKYRGDYKGYAYGRKSDSMAPLCAFLSITELIWGWGRDDKADDDGPKYVLYVEIPTGQVSFHSYDRGEGPDYQGKWDGLRLSATRIIEFGEAVLQHRSDSSERDSQAFFWLCFKP
jgi:hypothetical protein